MFKYTEGNVGHEKSLNASYQMNRILGVKMFACLSGARKKMLHLLKYDADEF